MSDSEEPYVLTAAGWPRPVLGGYPIPWVSSAERLGEVNEGRRLASVGGAVCQVCGEGWAYGMTAYGFVVCAPEGVAALNYGDYLSQIEDPSLRIFFVDGALLHHRCARLTAARCPHIRDATDLICVSVPANDADPMCDEDRRLRPTYPAGDVKYVPWPDPRRQP